ncbi:hypothetical protein A3Q56_05136, partial [Intoshia linei]
MDKDNVNIPIWLADYTNQFLYMRQRVEPYFQQYQQNWNSCRFGETTELSKVLIAKHTYQNIPKQSTLKRLQKTKKPRAQRSVYTEDQIAVLERFFNRNIFVTIEEKEHLCKKLNLTKAQVKVWYQNRRVKEKKSFTYN